MSESIVADPQPEKKVGFANKHQYRKTVEDEEKELIIKGDMEDMIDLDSTDWSNGGTEELDGVSYNVFTGTGANSTIKLLIEDDIDVTPDI